ncbi:P subunit p25 [Octopus vulgaris]|uniref:P subunit p25 n=2 Tax=Octopus TaxID=6643 RepID=A0AA36FGP2_OCTVU|nr:ribonuclease P protein subunit p25-like protein [Octopus sinensis]CAI9737885.1 P subunit p25 [Octopus vulgaris]
MENYTKGDVVTVEESKGPHLELQKDDIVMTVHYGSKIRNLIGLALNKMQNSNTKRIVWTGSGPAITKTITCAEIMKHKIEGLHQLNKLAYERVKESWLPKIKGLEKLIVNRDIPCISILLSKDQLDVNEPGYQAPGKCSIHEDSEDGKYEGKPAYKKQKQFKCRKRKTPSAQNKNLTGRSL